MDEPLGASAEADRGRREELSALMDGEIAGSRVREVCAVWRADAAAREAWHGYHLIGDVMRSQELACAPAHDEAFLQTLRTRMASEPVVIAPSAAPRTTPNPVPIGTSSGASMPMAQPARGGRTGRGWWGGAAAAAGFVVVIGAMVATRTVPPTQADSERMAAATGPVISAASGLSASAIAVAQPAPEVAALVPQAVTQTAGVELVSDGSVIRDPQLDHYLLAHKQFSGSSVLGAPSGFLRNAAVEFPAR